MEYNTTTLATSVLQKLNEFRKQSLFTDIELCVENQTFPCHQAVLASCSPLFHSNTTSEKSQSDFKEIMQNITATTLETVLDFMYTGKVVIDMENIGYLHQASNMLEFQELSAGCVKFKETNIKMEIQEDNQETVGYWTGENLDSGAHQSSGRKTVGAANCIVMLPRKQEGVEDDDNALSDDDGDGGVDDDTDEDITSVANDEAEIENEDKMKSSHKILNVNDRVSGDGNSFDLLTTETVKDSSQLRRKEESINDHDTTVSKLSWQLRDDSDETTLAQNTQSGSHRDGGEESENSALRGEHFNADGKSLDSNQDVTNIAESYESLSQAAKLQSSENLERGINQDEKLVGVVEKEKETTEFKCLFCDNIYTKEMSYKRHLRKHPEWKKFKCLFCTQHFTNKSSLLQHIKLRHKKSKVYECTICDEIFDKVSMFKSHKKTHKPEGNEIEAKTKISPKAGNLPKKDVSKRGETFSLSQRGMAVKKRLDPSKGLYNCKKCVTSFKTREKLVEHLQEHSIYDCLTCGKTLANKKSLLAHMNKHDGIKPHKCKYCDETFSHHGTMWHHMQKNHTELNKYSCEVCGQKFNKLTELRNHAETMKHFPDSVSCEICKSNFKTEAGLQQHKEKGICIGGLDCKECDITFKNKRRLREHNQNKHGKQESLLCEVCGKAFSGKRNLADHRKVHERRTSFQCQVCQKILVDKRTYLTHMNVHEGKKPYKCRYCDECFTFRGSLWYHEKSKHLQVMKYQCETCGEKFSKHIVWRRHIESEHTVKKPNIFNCQYCGKVLKTKRSFKAHINTHEGRKPYKCKHCEMHFSVRGTRWYHQRSKHPEKYSQDPEAQYQCTICDKNFCVRSQLKTHILTHSNEKRYQCTECGKQYSCLSGLAKHKAVVHTNIRPFLCDVCGKSFVVKSNLRAHIATHTDLRPYSCNICGKAFKIIASLRIHQKHMHSDGPKPSYPCPVCGKSFAMKHRVKRHLATHNMGAHQALSFDSVPTNVEIDTTVENLLALSNI